MKRKSLYVPPVAIVLCLHTAPLLSFSNGNGVQLNSNNEVKSVGVADEEYNADGYDLY